MLINPMLWGQSESGSPADEGLEMAKVEEVVEYEADDIRFRVDSGLGYLTGHAKVVRGSMTLTAHRIVLHLDDDEVCAYGTKDSLGA